MTNSSDAVLVYIKLKGGGGGEERDRERERSLLGSPNNETQWKYMFFTFEGYTNICQLDNLFTLLRK